MLGSLAFAGCEASADPASPTDSGTPKTDTGAPGTDTGTPGDTATTDTAPSASEELIDDMESATGSIASTKGRNGAWYTYNDTTAGRSTDPDRRCRVLAGKARDAARQQQVRRTHQGQRFHHVGCGLRLRPQREERWRRRHYETELRRERLHRHHLLGSRRRQQRDEGETPHLDEVDRCRRRCVRPGRQVRRRLRYRHLDDQRLGQIHHRLHRSLPRRLGDCRRWPAFEQNLAVAIHFQLAKGAEFDVWVDDIAFLKK